MTHTENVFDFNDYMIAKLRKKREKKTNAHVGSVYDARQKWFSLGNDDNYYYFIQYKTIFRV